MFRLLIAVLVLLPACTASDGESLVFDGSYTWGTEAAGALEVLFVPDGEDAWKIDFEFDYSGQRRTWTGTAQGNLETGPLEGRVQSDNPALVYIVRGQFSEGVFEGTHSEAGGVSETQSGTVQFKRRAGRRPR